MQGVLTPRLDPNVEGPAISTHIQGSRFPVAGVLGADLLWVHGGSGMRIDNLGMCFDMEDRACNRVCRLPAARAPAFARTVAAELAIQKRTEGCTCSQFRSTFGNLSPTTWAYSFTKASNLRVFHSIYIYIYRYTFTCAYMYICVALLIRCSRLHPNLDLLPRKCESAKCMCVVSFPCVVGASRAGVAFAEERFWPLPKLYLQLPKASYFCRLPI